MPRPRHTLSSQDISANVSAEDAKNYILQLYVAGVTDKSGRAIVNVRRLCEEHLRGRYQLEVVNLLQHPEVAAKEQIIAAPTLIKKTPEPVRRFIGDMSDTERLLSGLDIRAGKTSVHP